MWLTDYEPVLHDWCTKGCGMCYPVCGMMHIKEPLLLIGKHDKLARRDVGASVPWMGLAGPFGDMRLIQSQPSSRAEINKWLD